MAEIVIKVECKTEPEDNSDEVLYNLLEERDEKVTVKEENFDGAVEEFFVKTEITEQSPEGNASKWLTHRLSSKTIYLYHLF